MELKSDFRIIKNGEKIFGRGPCTLLEKVDELGSLAKATQELNMSYSKAWSIIRKAEKELGMVLLHTKTGGEYGGGSCITDEAKSLIKAYNDMCEEANGVMAKLYEKYFSSI